MFLTTLSFKWIPYAKYLKAPAPNMERGYCTIQQILFVDFNPLIESIQIDFWNFFLEKILWTSPTLFWKPHEIYLIKNKCLNLQYIWKSHLQTWRKGKADYNKYILLDLKYICSVNASCLTPIWIRNFVLDKVLWTSANLTLNTSWKLIYYKWITHLSKWQMRDVWKLQLLTLRIIKTQYSKYFL